MPTLHFVRFINYKSIVKLFDSKDYHDHIIQNLTMTESIVI